ncbi:MAG TPA: fibronectin type III domain-containing protein [Solirubrobacteraceae bacterium]|nr:fibronectin type III domain-containing protein [Solirubrobacteraceae bacterium]
MAGLATRALGGLTGCLLLLLPSPAHAADAAAPYTAAWQSQSEIQSLPVTGAAWSKLSSDATGTWPAPQISDQDNQHSTYVFAGALYYARTGDSAIRTKVRNGIMAARETENGGRVLALARNLIGYVLAADLINLADYSASDEAAFRTWLSGVRTESMTECSNLKACHEARPNNWGTHAGASRIAADVYLGDTVDLAAAASVFRGWVGDRSVYAGFRYGDLSWQCDSAAPVGINRTGCTKNGRDIDGVVPDDQRRCGTFVWPPCKTNYAWETLQGASVQADLLSRQGYDSWNWSNKAVQRAVDWLYRTTFSDGRTYPPEGDDTWIPWLVNRAYHSTFAAITPSSPGKNIGYTDWTHAEAAPPTTDTTAPTAPGGLTATNVTQSSATLGWSASSDNVGVDRYEVFADGTLMANVTGTSFTLIGLTCGAPHVLGVQARDAAGNVSARSEITTTTAACPVADTQAPTAPANFAVTASTQTSIDVSWDASTDDTGVAGYRVSRTGAATAEAAGTSHSFTGLTCGTSYTLQVVAYDAAGNTSPAAEIPGATTASCPAGDSVAPSPPTNLRVTSTTQTTVSIAWDAASDNVGVAGYFAWLDGVQVADAGAGLAFTYNGLSCGTTHRAEIRAYDAAGNVSASSASLGVTTAACPSTTTTLTPAHDAYVDGGSTSANFGTATLLSLDGSPVRRVYLRFVQPAGTPKSAKLRFYATSASSSGVSVSKATGTTASTWVESTLTFRNAPPFGTAFVTKPSITLGWNEVDIPVAQLSPGSSPTFVITRSSSTLVSVQSKENTNKPQLVITS